jgi:hypothetical protein
VPAVSEHPGHDRGLFLLHANALWQSVFPQIAVNFRAKLIRRKSIRP